MSQQQSPWLEGVYGWNFGEGGWNAGMDQNLLKFSFLFDGNVEGVVGSLPSPVNGQAYFLTTDSRLYFAVGTTWFSSPTPKWFEFKIRPTGVTFQYNGSVAVEIDSLSQLDSRLGAVELTISTLGTAAYEDVEFFATQAELDVATAMLSSGISDAVLTELDYGGVQAGVNAIGQLRRPISFAGRSVTLGSPLTNPYGVPVQEGKLLIPSLVAGFDTQLNTYADDANGLMIGRENLATFWKHVTAGTLQNIYIYGDSTVETSGAFPVKPHELFQQALYACGVNNAKVFNRGLSGTSWSDLSPTPGDIGASTKLIVIKYGINDATKANALATIAADARTKLVAIRATVNGDFGNLSILLMGPSSTYRPSQGQDAKWYEDLRNLYVQLCKEFNCAYFDTYAYLQDTSKAPGFWLDLTAPNEGLHPDPVAVYWIWREGIKTFVLGDGQWNISKANQLWNINNYTRVASSAVTPEGYNYGVIVESALTANGFPFNGILTTIRHSDGVAVQRLHTQDVVPRTTERRGGGAVWTQWSGVPTPIVGLNSWANKGGGYATAGFQVGADGFIDLYGVLAGGAAASTAFNLPVAARPAGAHEFRLASTGTATLFADGNFIVTGATTTMLSLDGIRFRALN